MAQIVLNVNQILRDCRGIREIRAKKLSLGSGRGFTMRERFPILTYEIRQCGRAGLGMGYLVETPDGRAWCFPSEETGMRFPGEDKPFALDAARLRPHADSQDGRRTFVYGPAIRQAAG